MAHPEAFYTCPRRAAEFLRYETLRYLAQGDPLERMSREKSEPALVLEQERRETGEITPPNHPGVRAGSFNVGMPDPA
jgi:hypothetical protein